MYPLIVRFEGEMGVDQGGLRMDFITLVTQMTEMILGGSHVESGLPKEDFRHLLYASGVFVGNYL